MLVTQTPLRISFFGGGTDFADFYHQEEGCVLSSAIDKSIFVIVKRRFDQMIRVGYTRTELVESVEHLQHELIREALSLVGIREQIEIQTLGDVPATGSGLGSSSAVTVGTLNALYTFLNAPRSLEDLARAACEIEINRLSKPIGKQDQYIAAYGGLQFIRFLPDERVVIEPVQLAESERLRLDRQLMLFYTNVQRRAESVLTEQRQNLMQNLSALRELKGMAYQGKKLLEEGNFEAFGRLLNDGWRLKKRLSSNISNPSLDEIYTAALRAGALGGKITGAGAGGFLLLYCPCEKQDGVRDALRGLRELPFHLETDSTKVILNYRRQGE